MCDICNDETCRHGEDFVVFIQPSDHSLSEVNTILARWIDEFGGVRPRGLALDAPHYQGGDSEALDLDYEDLRSALTDTVQGYRFYEGEDLLGLITDRI